MCGAWPGDSWAAMYLSMCACRLCYANARRFFHSLAMNSSQNSFSLESSKPLVATCLKYKMYKCTLLLRVPLKGRPKKHRYPTLTQTDLKTHI